jgi:hypothetical protein
VNCKIELFFKITRTTSITFTLNMVGSSCPMLYFSTLALSEKEILHQSKSVFECLKLPFCQGLGQNINYMLICGHILELHCSLLNPIPYEVIVNLYVLGPIMKHWILGEFDTTLIIIVNGCGIQLLIKQSCKQLAKIDGLTTSSTSCHVFCLY